jgi:hypothetical protein
MPRRDLPAGATCRFLPTLAAVCLLGGCVTTQTAEPRTRRQPRVDARAGSTSSRAGGVTGGAEAASGVTFAPASPSEPATRRAFLAVVINGSAVGEALVTLDGNDARLDATHLEAWGIHAHVPVDHQPGRPPEVSLNRLRGHLDYQVDERNLVLRLEVGPELFDPSFISLAPGRPLGLVQRWDTSAFLNWALRVDTHGTTTLDLEHGTRFGHALLEGSVSVGAGRDPTRGLTHILYDDPEHALRWTLGDAIERPGDLGGNLVLGGLVVAREPSLTPYLPRTPGLTFAGQASTPSTVEVYVDGVLDRRIPVAPGIFRIGDIPAPRGNGVATYVLRDAFGNEQRFARPYQIGRGLLAPGLDDLAVGVGFARQGLGTESFDYGAPVAFARRRLGLSDHVTFGWRAETAPFARLANAGTSLALALPVGQLDLGVGASLDDGQGGLAAFVGYELLTHGFGGTVYGVAKSDHYATLDLGRDDARTRFGLGTAMAVSGERWSTSLDVRARFPSPSDPTPGPGLEPEATRQVEARLATSIQLARGVDLRVQGAVVADEVSGESYSVGLVASFTPSAAVSVSALGELGPDGARGHLLASLPMTSEVGLGARSPASATARSSSATSCPTT